MPIFGRRPPRDADGFTATGIPAGTVRENELTPVPRTDALLTRVDGALIAFARHCPHAAADLADGSLHRGRISCPDHGWKFDVCTGRTLWPDDENRPLPRYPVKIVDDLIWVQLPPR